MKDKLMIVLGKTMSGKTTYINYLKTRGYEQVITHTTRPKRETEDDNAYHFEKEINGNGIALREYDMIDGHVGYWTELDDIFNIDQPVIITDYKGAVELIETLGMSNVRLSYINTSDEVITNRINNSKRGQTEDIKESIRRFEDDKKQFVKLDNFFEEKDLDTICFLSGEKFMEINNK